MSQKPVAGAPMHRHIIAIVQHLRAVGANIKAEGNVFVPARCRYMCAGAVSDERRYGCSPGVSKPALRKGWLRRLVCGSASVPPIETTRACAALRTEEKCDSCASLRQLGFFNCRAPRRWHLCEMLAPSSRTSATSRSSTA